MLMDLFIKILPTCMIYVAGMVARKPSDRGNEDRQINQLR
jgi:hypothetical protein